MDTAACRPCKGGTGIWPGRRDKDVEHRLRPRDPDRPYAGWGPANQKCHAGDMEFAIREGSARERCSLWDVRTQLQRSSSLHGRCCGGVARGMALGMALGSATRRDDNQVGAPPMPSEAVREAIDNVSARSGGCAASLPDIAYAVERCWRVWRRRVGCLRASPHLVSRLASRQTTTKTRRGLHVQSMAAKVALFCSRLRLNRQLNVPMTGPQFADLGDRPVPGAPSRAPQPRSVRLFSSIKCDQACSSGRGLEAELAGSSANGPRPT